MNARWSECQYRGHLSILYPNSLVHGSSKIVIIQCILAYPNLDYPNSRLSELQITVDPRLSEPRLSELSIIRIAGTEGVQVQSSRFIHY